MDAPEDSTALAYLIARIPQYPQYVDEVTRHQSDKLVRGYVGEALAEARDRYANAIDAALAAALDDLVLHCQFTDQRFVKHLEHAELDAAQSGALIAADRDLVELADRLRTIASAELAELVRLVDATFARRRAPFA